MRAFSFHPGPRVIAGPGSADKIHELVPKGACLFVTDRQLVSLGLTDSCRSALSDHGIEPILFADVEEDPSKETLIAAVNAGRDAAVTSVVGFGGGSPMDVAKLAAYLLGSGNDLETIWGVNNASGGRLPLALVPTTAGTGSETTPISIITCEGSVKMGVNSWPLMADWAILDASLTVGLPSHVTAATGIDAMVHAVEAYTSARLKNPISDALAREALRLLSANLIRVIEHPDDLDARSAMLLGANLAGQAFANAPVAGVHALAYPLGGLHHLPHGLSNALMLRPVLSHNLEAARELYAELADVIAPGDPREGSQARAARLIDGLDQLATASGLRLRLRDHGIGFDEAPVLAREAMRQTRLLVNNPCDITEADAQRLYEAAW